MTRNRSRLAALIVAALLVSFTPLTAAPAAATTGDLVITGVVDGPLTGGLPKAIELYVANDIPDLSIYGVGSANNGGGTDGQEFAFPAMGATAGDFLYVATESTGFAAFFGFAPDFISTSAASVNGDDAIELFLNGGVVDVFGEATHTGAGPWDYTDGWAYRVPGSGQDSTFVLGDWTFSGANALDGEATNAAAATPFPIGSYTEDPVSPPDPIALSIHEIQGSGTASPFDGTLVTVEAVVVGDFQGSGALRGFYLQEEDGQADTDPLTSEGIFVFDGSFGIEVSMGDLVQVTGTVDEFNGLTEITAVSAVTVVTSGNSVTPATVELPVTDLSDLETFEGMSVHLPQSLTISEFFNFDRFGEIVLTVGRQFQPTALFAPGSAAAEDLAAANALGRITLDDGRSSQNPDPAIHPNGAEFTLENRFRGGDTVTNVTGVLDFSFGLYRIHPTQGADYMVGNPRPAKHDKVGGQLEVAAFNVLNYFSTIDTGVFICGPLEDQECRGADDAGEFTRQRDKIITALAEIDADVVGLMEIENHPTDAALVDLVAGLNERMGTGTYAHIGSGAIGPDAIRIAIIYKPQRVTPLGADAVLDSEEFLDPNGLGGAQNRPAQAQTFQEKNGATFTVVVNHLKSKGSECGPGDDDPVQGNCNLTRTLSAQVLTDWLATDPTGSADPDFLIIGDLNSYDKEDPIGALTAGPDDTRDTGDDYTDLLHRFQGEEEYSFLFDGQLGYLDYALASQSLLYQARGATVWHINADEPDLIDYDTTFKADAQDALYAPDQYRSSDHEAVIVGLHLDKKQK